ncbi:MAG: Bro-N domain-containing protein [Vibrio sp.]|uniref:BRO-N domain-containing protein n=1 Tax=Vibrio sp. TaxID=678 RepID=UPI003A8AEFE9
MSNESLPAQIQPLNCIGSGAVKIEHIPFTNSEFGQLNVLPGEDGQIWFIANEVAQALGYKRPRDAIRKLVKDKNKGAVNWRSPGGTQEVTTINESGLYSLIMRSKLAKAEEFQEWVTGEVLPSIRKHGGYTAGQEELSPEELMAKAVLVAESRIQEQELENKRLNSALSDLSTQLASGITPPAFCMQLNGVNTQEVQGALVRLGILIRERHGFRPSAPYRNKAFECTSYEYAPGKRNYTSLVTPSGAFLLYKLYRNGKLPMRKDWNGSYTTSQLTKEQITAHQPKPDI